MKLYLIGALLLCLGLGTFWVYREIEQREQAAYVRGQLAQKVTDDSVLDVRTKQLLEVAKTAMLAAGKEATKTIEHFHETTVDPKFAQLPLQKQVDSLKTLGADQAKKCTLFMTEAAKLQTSCEEAVASRDQTITDLKAQVAKGTSGSAERSRPFGLGIGAGYGPQWQTFKSRPTWGWNVSAQGHVTLW